MSKFCSECKETFAYPQTGMCAECSIRTLQERIHFLEQSLISPENFGERVINFIIKSELVHTDPKTIFVWSANAAEQITQFLKDQYLPQPAKGSKE